MKIIYDAEKLKQSLPKKERSLKISKCLSIASAVSLLIMLLGISVAVFKYIDNNFVFLFFLGMGICTIGLFWLSCFFNIRETDALYNYYMFIVDREILKTDIRNKTLLLDLKDKENNVISEEIYLNGFSIKYKTDVQETEINLDEKVILIPYELEESKNDGY